MRDTVRPIEPGLACLLLLAPLLFGAVEFWSLAIMEILCFSLLLLWSFRMLSTKQPPAPFIRPPLLVPIALLLAFTIIQLIPLPPWLLKILSPGTYGIYRETFPPEGSLPWLTLSLYPYATFLEIVRFISYICVYFLAIQIVRDRKSIARITAFVIMAGTGIALLGIVQFIFWNGKLLWFRELTQGGNPFGPYVNRNHFAGLMEMIIPVAAGMLVYLLPSIRNSQGVKTAAADFFTHRKVNAAILAGAAAVIMSTALFLSLSRGGIIGLSLSMLFFGSMLALRSSTRKKGRTIIGLFLVILLTVGWFGWSRVIERFEKIKHVDASSEYRINNWKDSVNIVAAFPVFGTGLGTYGHIYPKYKTVPTQERWDHAHNDYIEAAVELGIPGLAIALYVMGSFYLIMFRILTKRKSLYSRLLGIGGMAGITGIMIHSLTDFNLRVGANGLYFAFLMGFTIAVSHLRTGEGNEGTFLKVAEIKAPPGKRTALKAGILLIFVFLSAISLLNFGAEIYYALAKGSIREGSELVSRGMMIKKARILSPLDARLAFAEGNIDYALERTENAAGNYAVAVALNPANGEYLQMLGIAYGNMGKKESAERFMKLAVRYDPTSAWMRKNYSLWLFSNGNKELALKEMKEAIALDPSNTRKYIASLVLSKVTPDEMRDTIREIPPALLLYGRYREEMEDTEGALESYLDALTVMKREGDIKTEVYHRIAGLYEKKGLLGQAMAYYEEGVKNSPSDYGLRFRLAKLYDRLDIPYRAKEEYEKVLILNPLNEYAQRRLKDLGGR